MDVNLPLPVPMSSAGANHFSTSSQPLQREHSTSQDKEDPIEGLEFDAQSNNNFCGSHFQFYSSHFQLLPSNIQILPSHLQLFPSHQVASWPYHPTLVGPCYWTPNCCVVEAFSAKLVRDCRRSFGHMLVCCPSLQYRNCSQSLTERATQMELGGSWQLSRWGTWPEAWPDCDMLSWCPSGPSCWPFLDPGHSIKCQPEGHQESLSQFGQAVAPGQEEGRQEGTGHREI